MQKPLDGIRVISMEHAIAAPFCSRQLADLGARVIKIERPVTGDFARNYDQRVDGMSSHFVWTNRSKESLTLDIKQASAFHDGPYRDKKAYDLLIQSEAGFLSITGTPEEPSKAGCSIADIAAGMYAYTNIMSAILLRQKTGIGSHIDISMLEALGEWMGYPLYYAYQNAPPPPRTGASHATIYPYGRFSVGGNAMVMLGLQNEREWQLFCEKVLLQPELVHDARFANNALRNTNRTTLKEMIEQCFLQLSITAVQERLDSAQIANARMNDMAQVWDHPQLQARNRWQEISTPIGKVPALLPPGKNNQFTYRMDPVPEIGEHTNAILNELGLEDAQITNMKNTEAI